MILALSATFILIFHRVFIATDEEIRARLRISIDLDRLDFSEPLIAPKNINFLSTPKNVCPNQAEEYDIVCYVIVRHDDFQARQVIRNTWADKKKFSYVNIFFVLGVSQNDSLNKQIMDENEKFGDILIGDFLDKFRNLSLKSIVAWKWMSESCQKAKLFVKANNDMLVNFQSIRNSIKQNFFKNNTFFCRVISDQKVDRERSSLFYTKYSEYSNSIYPKYCQNHGAIISNDLISKLYSESNKIRNFWIEEINMGILADRLKASYQNAIDKQINSKLFEEEKKKFDDYFFVYGFEGSKNLYESWLKFTKQ